MSGSNFSTKILAWLKNQHVIVPVEWVEACLDWLQDEGQIHGQENSAQAQRLVYEQWLMTDVSELAKPSFPEEVTSEKYTLTGSYCVQVNSIVDISQPFYGQLMQIQDKDNPNSRVSAETQITQKPWEAKPSRMLILKLTDGVTEVSGMEHRNIPTLNEKLPPGCKICIKGPVNCRRGVLMLAASNVRFLGGEIDDMKSENNREAVLCRRLNRPVSSRSANRLQQATPSLSNNNSNFDLPADVISQLTEDDFLTETDSGYVTGATSFTSSSNTNNPASVLHDPSYGGVDEMDGLSDMDILQEIERVESQQTQQTTNSRRDLRPCETNVAASNHHVIVMEVETGKDDADFALQQSNVANHEESHSKSSSKPSRTNITSKQLSIEDAFKQNFKPLPSALQSYANRPLRGEIKSIDSSSCIRPAMKNEDIHATSSSRPPVVKIKFELPLNAENSGVLSKENRTHPATLENAQENTCPSLLSRLSELAKEPIINQPLPCNDDVNIQRKFSDNVSNSRTKEKLDKSFTPKQPNYICQAKALMAKRMISSFSITVKACITTLLSKLSCDPAAGWSLKARICDGTGVLDVQFSDQVLTNLIGFSSNEADDIKTSHNSLRLTELRRGMEKCRDQIIGMCKLMKIENGSSSYSKPYVRQLLDTDEAFWSNIRHRTSRI